MKRVFMHFLLWFNIRAYYLSEISKVLPMNYINYKKKGEEKGEDEGIRKAEETEKSLELF